VYVGSTAGALCRVAPAEPMRSLLSAGPLAAQQPASATARQLNGIVLASAAKYGGARLEEAGLLGAFQVGRGGARRRAAGRGEEAARAWRRPGITAGGAAAGRRCA
jgi:hypothetical protein